MLPLRPYDASPSPENADETSELEGGGGGDDFSTTDGGESTTTFSPSLQELWFKESHGHLVQSSNEAYQWPADDWHLRHEELWGEWKTTFLSSTERKGGGAGSGGGLYPAQIGARIEELLLKRGSMFLDVGCGRRADWLCAMGDRFPCSEGVGVDTQPIVSDCLPFNVCGELYDCSQNLPYPDEYFDLITHAYLCPFLTNDWNYPRLLSEIARCLKPGGVYFCVDKHTTGFFPESGQPIQQEFPAFEAFLRLSSFWGTRGSTDYRFKPDVLVTQAFDLVEEEVVTAQFGCRGVDPIADQLGTTFLEICKHIISNGSWFLLQAGFSQEQGAEWARECALELATMEKCEFGKGAHAQLHLVYAVKKKDLT
ncbi:S-adenosyl-L-methionine-dependent methyltransferase [Mrakia frigida]|uniref:S-adenosyl-L-methionine-dependent methyltransferase n=1 Tax=Mrakia frigida TaxID=29902 RepID=UPI003FCBF73A